MMTRQFTRTITTSVALAALLLTPVSAEAVGLKQNSVITGDTITLGDVFYDLPRDEDRVLGTAPRPGEDMVLNARTLLRIAMAMDLSWRPSSNAEQVTLSRHATVIDYHTIKDAINTALYDDGVFGEYEIDIPAQHQQIILPHTADATMEITHFSVGTDRKTFKATIAAPSARNPIQHVTVTGVIHPVIKVPVLKNNIAHGRVIQRKDIEYIKIKERDFRRNTIVDVETLIGMTPRRMAIAGRPLLENDILARQIVARGKLVTLSLSEGAMNITTQVKAMENGAKGDVIRVVNLSSNQTLQAVVTGEGAVTVIQ